MGVIAIMSRPLILLLLPASVCALTADGVNPPYSFQFTQQSTPPTIPLAGIPTVYRPGNGIRPPLPVKSVKPSYTREAMRAGIQGTAVVEAVVLPDGTVGSVVVVKSLDKENGLDDEAVKAAKQWRFRPGTKDGVPVPVLVTIELVFTTGDDRAAPMEWPSAMSKLPVPPVDWTQETIEGAAVILHVSHPRDWTMTPGLAGTWFTMRAPKASPILSVLPPRVGVTPPAGRYTPGMLREMRNNVSKGLTDKGSKAELMAVGQVTAANVAWAWYYARLPPGDPAVLGYVPTDVAKNSYGAFLWSFTSVTGGQQLTVQCVAPQRRDATVEEADSEKLQAAAVCRTIVEKMSIDFR